jgi:hypothetical protein
VVAGSSVSPSFLPPLFPSSAVQMMSRRIASARLGP